MVPEDSIPQDDEDAESDPSSDDAETDLSVDDAEADLRPDVPRPDDPAEDIEPAVPDPTADLGLGPGNLPDESDVDPELRKQFWSVVLLFNVALFGMSLGLMLVGFEGRWRIGGAVFAVGAVAFARGWRGYRRATADVDD